jgi:hypothetical protein
MVRESSFPVSENQTGKFVLTWLVIMLPKRKIDLEISSALEEAVKARLDESGLKNPIAGIDWGRWDDEKEDYLIVGSVYDRDLLPMEEPIQIIDVHGIEFVVVQDWLCEMLEGKRLEVANDKVTIVCRGSGRPWTIAPPAAE